MFGRKEASKGTTSVAWGKLRFGKDKGKNSTRGLNPFQAFEDKRVDDELAKGFQGVSLTVTEEEPSQQDAPTTDKNSDINSNGSWTHVPSRPRTTNKLPAPSVSFATPNTTRTTEAPWRTDWRAPRDPEAELARQAAAVSIYTTGGDRKKYRTGPRTKGGVYFCDQRPGAIIFRPDKRANPSRNIPDDDPSITRKDGVRYRTKGRYWLIVKVTPKRVWECPIYTNNDTGLRFVDPKFWKEYFGLLPMGVAREGFKNQSPGNKVFSIRWMNEDDDQLRKRTMRSTMVVHFTEVKARLLDHNDVALVGALAIDEVDEACEKAGPFIR